MERNREYLVHRIDRHELDMGPDIVGDIAEILLVDGREQHGIDPGPVGSERLFAQAPNYQHLAPQTHFASHRDVVADRPIAQNGSDHQTHGDAGGSEIHLA